MRIVAALLLAAAGSTQAADVSEVTVTHDDGRYAIHMQARLDATPRAAYAAFTDYERLPQMNGAIEQVARLPDAPTGSTRLRTQIRVCVAFYCKHLRQVQDIRDVPEAGGYALEAKVLPQMSDLRYGAAHWRMTACGGQTCLDFRAELEPDFWVPPLIGPWLIERKMRQEAEVTAQGIERLSHDYAH